MQNRKEVFSILLIVFTNLLGAGTIIPVLPLYAEGEFGGTVSQITLLTTAYFAAQFLAAPYLGRLSDQFGRRPVLLVSQLGTVISFVLFIFAAEIGGWLSGLGLPMLGLSGGMFMLFAARILDGITGGNITAARAYLSDISTQETRTQAFGWLSAAISTGFIFGPAFGGLLASFGARAPFIGAALITTITLLLTVGILKESLPPEKRQNRAEQKAGKIPLGDIFANRELALIFILGFLTIAAFSAIPPTFALYADRVVFPELGSTAVAQRVGGMMAFVGFAGVITQTTLLQPLVKRLGERRVIIFGHVVWGLDMILIPVMTSPLASTLLLAPFAFGRGVVDPTLQSLTTRFSTDQNRGQMLGLFQAAQSLAFIISPIWAGYVFEHISPAAVFYVGAGIIFVGLIVSIFLYQATEGQKKTQTTEG